MIAWATWILVGYVVGSVPFGFIIARSRGVDIRSVGSGNVGATNVGRVLGRRFGIVCFFLDAAKGAGPVIAAGAANELLGRPLAGGAGQPPPAALDVALWLAVAVATLLGHMFPVWLRFRGGKGVATGFGALVSMWPLLTLPALAGLLVWAITIWFGRLMSLASMVAAASLPLSCLVLVGRAARVTEHPRGAVLSGGTPLVAATLLLAALVIFRHRSNLARLRAGTEPRIGK